MKTFLRYRKNLGYDENFIYSYGTKVARIKPDRIEKLGWFSPTTSKHVNYAAGQLGLQLYEPMDPDLPFCKDLGKTIQVNEGSMAVGVWNLLVSIRDVSLYTKGIKPHRNWRISDVKTYFGVKGSPEKVLQQLLEIKSGYEEAVDQAKQSAQ